MSEHLPAVTGRQLLRALQRAGFVIDRQTGSHIRLEKGTAKVTISVHGSRTLRVGTVAAVLRDAGLTADDLRKLL